jgi:uncharacterized membrane protein YdjX (TVP38/TMEM64 family)
MKRRLLFLAPVALGLAIIAWLGRSYFTLEALAQHERELRRVIDHHQVLAWLIGFGIYFLLAMVPGTRGKAVVYGWFFGFWQGFVLVNLALTAAAMAAFLISRKFVRELIQERYQAKLVVANRALEREGAWYVILLRVLPVPYSLTNYLMGATNVSPKTFWWATHVGLIPSNVAFVFVGSELPSLGQLATEGFGAIFSWRLAIGVTILSLLPFVVHWLATRIRATFAVNGRSQLPSVPQ